MKKLILIVICLGLLRINGAAQGIYFNRTYTYLKTASIAQCAIILNDSSYIISGFNNIPSPGAGNYVFLRKVNKNGDTIYVKSFPVRTNHTSFINCGANSIFKCRNGYRIMGLNNHSDTSYNIDYTKFFMCDIDSVGDTLNYKEYGYDTLIASSISNAIRTRDGGYALPGWEFSPKISGVENMFILKTDSLGNEKFKTIIPGGVIGAYSVAEAKDKGMVLIGISTNYPYTPGSPTTMHIVKVDSNGKYQWTKDWGTGSAENTGWDIQPTKDGGFLALGFKTVYIYTSTSDFVKPWLLRLDSAGNVIWERLYGDTLYQDEKGNDFMRLIPTHDSNYIIMGNLNRFLPYRYSTFLLKIKPNGDSLWWRYLPRGQQADQIRDIKQTPDRGFILCGYKYNSSKKPDVWLIKTDSLGCDIGGCNITGTEEITPHIRGTLTIYPNPTTGAFTLTYTLPLNTQKASIHITTLLGEEVKTYPIPSHSNTYSIEGLNLAEGMYICQIYADGEISASTRMVLVKQ